MITGVGAGEALGREPLPFELVVDVSSTVPISNFNSSTVFCARADSAEIQSNTAATDWCKDTVCVAVDLADGLQALSKNGRHFTDTALTKLFSVVSLLRLLVIVWKT
jgi:hypothetical protein